MSGYKKDTFLCHLEIGVRKMAFKLLLVEDDAEIREIIADYFIEKSNGTLTIDFAKDGYEGQEKCLDNEYDLIILDVMLPEIDGFTICREIRKVSDVPIIFMTAREAEDDKLYGYQLGCDDYVTKFFVSRALCKSKCVVETCKRYGKKRNDDGWNNKIRSLSLHCFCK